MWSETYGGEFDDSGWTVKQVKDGGFVIAAQLATSEEYEDKDIYIIRTDAEGGL